MKSFSILIVEDEALIGLATADLLHLAGYHVSGVVSTGEEALKHVEAKAPDLILMDIHLAGDLDGIETAQLIQKRFNVPVIYVSANLDEPTLDRIKNTCFTGCLDKPVRPDQLTTLMKQSLAGEPDCLDDQTGSNEQSGGYFNLSNPFI